MPRFYFTYGSDERFPFQGGWTMVAAPNQAVAYEAFRAFHPDRNGCLNCSDVYTETEFESTKMYQTGNRDCRCHERIAISRELLSPHWTE